MNQLSKKTVERKLYRCIQKIKIEKMFAAVNFVKKKVRRNRKYENVVLIIKTNLKENLKININAHISNRYFVSLKI